MIRIQQKIFVTYRRLDILLDEETPSGISSTNNTLMYMRSEHTGTITAVRVWVASEAITSGSFRFNVRKNGVGFWASGDQIALSAGVSSGAKTGLNIATVKGDVLVLDLAVLGTGSINAPVVWMVEFEDGVVLSEQGQICLEYALSDETTALTTGNGKLTARLPFPFAVDEVRASLSTASSSGDVVVDINKNSTTIFDTDELTVDQGDKTSVGSASPYVLDADPTNFADDDEVTFDIVSAGTGAAGLKVKLLGTQIV